MQVGYVLRFGDQVARAAEQTTRPVTSAGCGDRAHCRRAERLVLILQCHLAGTPDWQICHDRMAA